MGNRQHYSTRVGPHPHALRLDSHARSPQPQALCVAIDILDEAHSLRLAMRRLATDAGLRERLGRAGRAWWAREHSLDAMVEDYVAAIARAMARPAPDVELPAHTRDRGDGTLRTLIEPFGLAPALSRDRLLR